MSTLALVSHFFLGRIETPYSFFFFFHSKAPRSWEMNTDWCKPVMAIPWPFITYSFFLVSIDPDKKIDDDKSTGEFLGFLFPDKSQGQQAEKVYLHPGYPTASCLCMALAVTLKPWAWGEKKPTQQEWQSGQMEQAQVPDTCPWAAGANGRPPTSREHVVTQYVALGFKLLQPNVSYLTQDFFPTEGHRRGRRISCHFSQVSQKGTGNHSGLSAREQQARLTSPTLSES